MTTLAPGDVVLVDVDGIGREQAGLRPAVVVSSSDHLQVVDQLVTVIPCSRTDRDWPNHVMLTGEHGLPQATFALTEQVRTIDRARLRRRTGAVDADCLRDICEWMRDWSVCAS